MVTSCAHLSLCLEDTVEANRRNRNQQTKVIRSRYLNTQRLRRSQCCWKLRNQLNLVCNTSRHKRLSDYSKAASYRSTGQRGGHRNWKSGARFAKNFLSCVDYRQKTTSSIISILSHWLQMPVTDKILGFQYIRDSNRPRKLSVGEKLAFIWKEMLSNSCACKNC